MDAAATTVNGTAERHRARLEHRTPLAGRTLHVLDEAREFSNTSELLFPSPTGHAPNDKRSHVGEGIRAPQCADQAPKPLHQIVLMRNGRPPMP